MAHIVHDLGEGAALDVLQHDAELAALELRVDVLDDVRVAQVPVHCGVREKETDQGRDTVADRGRCTEVAPHELDFHLDGADLLLGEAPDRDDLHRDDVPLAHVDRLVHHARAACAEQSRQ